MGNVRLARTITFPGKGDYINPRTIPSRSCVGTAAEDRARKRAVACGYTLEAAIITLACRWKALPSSDII